MRPSPRPGFSLLEVMMATTILLGSVAVLAHIAYVGRRHAQAVEDLSAAQLVCQTRLNEILAGAVLPQATGDEPIPELPGWSLSVAVEPAGRAGLLAVKVTAAENPAAQLPTAQTQSAPGGRRFTLVRWIRDPNGPAQTNPAAAAPSLPSPFGLPPADSEPPAEPGA